MSEDQIVLVVFVVAAVVLTIVYFVVASWLYRKLSQSTAVRPQYRILRGDLLRSDEIFVFDRRKYRRYARDLAVSRFLMTLQDQRQGGDAGKPLLAWRDDFRCVAHDQPLAGLVWCLVHGDEQTRRLAVWLLGRCGDSQGISPVACYRWRSERKLRLTVAKALHRLRARAQLHQMALSESDPWLRDFAAARAIRSFDSQLSGFVGHDAKRGEAAGEAYASRMIFILNVDPLVTRRPKSAEYIRRLLEHIRELLRGRGRAVPPKP